MTKITKSTKKERDKEKNHISKANDINPVTGKPRGEGTTQGTRKKTGKARRIRVSTKRKYASIKPQLPVLFCQDSFEYMMQQIEEGRTLNYLGRRDPKCPSKSSFYSWLKSDPKLRDRYDEARLNRAESLMDQAVDIAFDDTRDGYSKLAVARDRLKVDVLKAIAGADNSRYSNKVKHEGKIDNNVTIQIQDFSQAIPEETNKVIDVTPPDVIENK